jgi:hypothetical protein
MMNLLASLIAGCLATALLKLMTCDWSEQDLKHLMVFTGIYIPAGVLQYHMIWLYRRAMTKAGHNDGPTTAWLPTLTILVIGSLAIGLLRLVLYNSNEDELLQLVRDWLIPLMLAIFMCFGAVSLIAAMVHSFG